MFKKLLLTFLLFAASSVAAKASDAELNSVEELSLQLEQELSAEELKTLENLEMELYSRRGNILRDIIIDQLLPDRRRGRVVCYASNRRGHSYRATGRRAYVVQQKALRKCDRNSRRHCYADGCRRVRRGRR